MEQSNFRPASTNESKVPGGDGRASPRGRDGRSRSRLLPRKSHSAEGENQRTKYNKEKSSAKQTYIPKNRGGDKANAIGQSLLNSDAQVNGALDAARELAVVAVETINDAGGGPTPPSPTTPNDSKERPGFSDGDKQLLIQALSFRLTENKVTFVEKLLTVASAIVLAYGMYKTMRKLIPAWIWFVKSSDWMSFCTAVIKPASEISLDFKTSLYESLKGTVKLAVDKIAAVSFRVLAPAFIPAIAMGALAASSAVVNGLVKVVKSTGFYQEQRRIIETYTPMNHLASDKADLRTDASAFCDMKHIDPINFAMRVQTMRSDPFKGSFLEGWFDRAVDTTLVKPSLEVIMQASTVSVLNLVSTEKVAWERITNTIRSLHSVNVSRSGVTSLDFHAQDSSIVVLAMLRKMNEDRRNLNYPRSREIV